MHRDDVAAVVGRFYQQRADMRRDFLERLSARPPRCVLVVASDQIGALMADCQLGNVLGNAKAAHQGAHGAPQIVQPEIDAAVGPERRHHLGPTLEPTAGAGGRKQQRA